MHALEPTTRLYVPAGQATQFVITPVYPTLHKHCVLPGTATEFVGHVTHVLFAVACTTVEYLFAGHSKHDPTLTLFLYVPAAHDLQSLRPLPANPALH